jgi:hypothetical protein
MEEISQNKSIVKANASRIRATGVCLCQQGIDPFLD